MKQIPIYVWDDKKCKENELLDIDDEVTYLETLFFSETSLDCYWLDLNEANDIIFHIGGTSFKTPYTKESEDILKSCLI